MIVLFLLSFLLQTEPARARVYDLYRSDRRFKGSFCTAIGGACAADADIVTGIFENPAALANGTRDWDFDGDYSSKSNLEPGMKGDNDVTETAGVLGASYSTGEAGVGLAFAQQVNEVDSNLTIYDASNRPTTIKSHSRGSLIQLRLPFALRVSRSLSIGAALSTSRHSYALSLASAPSEIARDSSQFRIGTTIGVLYEASSSLRLGSWFRFPNTLRETIRFNSSSLPTPIAYSEDLTLHSPWVWALGSNYSLSELTGLFAEVDMIGTTKDGYLLSYDTFSATVNDYALRAKGRSVVLEPHVGARRRLGERLILHAGSYYETSRWEGLDGRLHGSFGLSYDIKHFVKLIAGLDFAKNYSQIIFTFR